MSTTHTIYESPIGPLTLVAQDRTLRGVYFPGHWTLPDPATFGEQTEGDEGCFAEARRQLDEYFAGERTTFALDTVSPGSDFQRRVWACLDAIPYGETTTYGAIARELGDPKRAREVGNAVGRNPLSIIRPCHRVVGHDGGLTGFAGGLERKRALLDLEAVTSGQQLFAAG